MSWLREHLPPDSGGLQRAVTAALTTAQYGLGALRRHERYYAALDGPARAWADVARRDGYCVVPSFLDATTCRRYVAEIDRLFAEYPAYVRTRSDRRLFGAETGSSAIREFAEEPRLGALAAAIFGEPTQNAFTLAARLDYQPGNLGSGEGWHRDSFVMQVKAVLYLTDVANDNGPFQFLAGSHRLPTTVGDVFRAGLGFEQNRVADAQIERLLGASPDRLLTFTAPAGTLLLVNTSGIHRGCPIRAGTRYALTNYYFPKRHIRSEVFEHFAPVLGHGTRGADAP